MSRKILREWLLTANEETRLMSMVTALLRSSLIAGREMRSNCPDYASACGILNGIKFLGLISHEEREIMLKRAKECAQQEHEAESAKAVTTVAIKEDRPWAR